MILEFRKSCDNRFEKHLSWSFITRFWCPRVLKVCSKSSWQRSPFDTRWHFKAMMERKTRCLKYKNCLLQNMKQMAVWILIWRWMVSWQNQRNGTSWEIIWWSVTRSILQSSLGEDFYELEVEGFLREDLWNETELVIKTRSSLIPVRYQRKFWDM